MQSKKLDDRSRYLRGLVVSALEGGGRGHVGSAMSLIEILRVLYDDVLNYQATQPKWVERDRCILSKGHGCLALYALLADKGFFSKDELKTFCESTSILGGHPEIKTPGVEASTGALGHGLSIGVGMAMAARMQKRNSRVFVIVGDGEINEGSVWEAAMAASKHQLNNLTVIIDCNKIQSYGATEEVLNMEPLKDKWSSFGFLTYETDGHDVLALQSLFNNSNVYSNKPTAIICHTVKGKGFDFAESNPEWHHKSKLKPEEILALNQALEINA